MKQKHDWDSLKKLYDASEEDLTLTQFCKQEGLPYDTTRIAFSRLKQKQANEHGPLTPRQELFVREYLIDLNATQAYLRAGYIVSPKVAAVNAAKMLRNPKISQVINEALGRMLAKLEITNETVLQEIARVAFCNIIDYLTIQPDGTACIDLSNLTRDKAAAIAEYVCDDAVEGTVDGARPVKRIKFKLGNKLQALEMLGKYLKLFNDTMQPPLSGRARRILKRVRAGKMDKVEAAYILTELGEPLPEVLKIEISKVKPEPPPPEPPPALDDEELERLYQEAMKKHGVEVETWVPKRQEGVKKIKDELGDSGSFVPDKSENRTNKKSGRPNKQSEQTNPQQNEFT